MLKETNLLKKAWEIIQGELEITLAELGDHATANLRNKEILELMEELGSRLSPSHLVIIASLANRSTFRPGSILMQAIMKVAAMIPEEPFEYVRIERIDTGDGIERLGSGPDGFIMADLGYDDEGNHVFITTNGIPASRLPRCLYSEQLPKTICDAMNQHISNVLAAEKRGELC